MPAPRSIPWKAARRSGKLIFAANVCGQTLWWGSNRMKPSTRDNSYTEGANLAADFGILRIHGLGKFMQYMGFGHSTNSTMVPGESFDGLFEARIEPH